MKSKIIKIIKDVITFLFINLLYVYPLIKYFWKYLYELLNINNDILNIIMNIIITIISLFISIIIFVKIYKEFYNRKINFFTLLNIIIVTSSLFYSLRYELEIDIERAESLISKIWTWAALLLALIVTWIIIAEKDLHSYDKVIKPKGFEKRITNFFNDGSKYEHSRSYLNNLYLVILPIFILSFITPYLLISRNINLFLQTMIYFILNMTPIIMLNILFDILYPIISLLKKSKKIDDNILNRELVKGLIEDGKIKHIDYNLDDLSDEEVEQILFDNFDICREEMKNLRK